MLQTTKNTLINKLQIPFLIKIVTWILNTGPDLIRAGWENESPENFWQSTK